MGVPLSWGFVLVQLLIHALAGSYMLDTSYDLPSALRRTFAQPTKISSSDGSLSITLTVEAYRVTTELFSYTTRAYCYNGKCSVPGPTISVKPGDTLTIVLQNKLAADTETGTMNTMHSPNKTNIHTHGLHIAPTVDNIFIEVNGGETHTYVYNIPEDHTPGTHWYHSHLHGTAALHVMGGLVGALIVEPYETTDLPSALQTMTHKVMVFTHVMIDRIGGNGTGASEINTDPFTVLTYNKLSTKTGSSLSINPVMNIASSTVWDAWFVNGQYQPTLYMLKNEYLIFDMICASGDRILELQIRDGVGISGGTQLGGSTSACTWYLLALDGIYLSSSRKSSSYTYAKHLVMIPGQRASIAVKCTKAGNYYFQTVGSTTDSTSADIGDIEVKSQQILFHLTVNSTATTTTYSDPPTTLGVTRPSYLTSLESTTISSANTWSMSVEQTGCCGTGNAATYWLGIGTNCTLSCFGREDCIDLYTANWDVRNTAPVTSGQCEYETFPGEIGDDLSADYRHSAQLGTPQELTLWGRGKSAHPMHVHVTLMQFIRHVYYSNGNLKDLSTPYGEEGDWRDTWPALPGKSVLRMNFANYEGEYVTHCHFLKHEDMGMMATFFVYASPSAAPTTAKPTTAEPTGVPSTATPSTQKPTGVPSTAAPSESPTLAPVSGTKTFVTFSTSLTLSNVTVADIDNDDFKSTFAAAVMDALEAQDFPASEVTNIEVVSAVLATTQRSVLDHIYASIESVWRILYYFFIDEDSLQSSTSSLSPVDAIVTSSSGAKVTYDIVLVLQNSAYSSAASASTGLTTILSSSACTTLLVTALNNGGYSVTTVSAGTTTVTDTSTITDDEGDDEVTVLGLALWIVILVGVAIILVIAVIITLFIRKVRSLDKSVVVGFDMLKAHDHDGLELPERESVAFTIDTVHSENNSSMDAGATHRSITLPRKSVADMQVSTEQESHGHAPAPRKSIA